MQNYSREVSFPHPLQQGFRPGCGSIMAAFVLSKTVNHYLERDPDVFVAFLDNEKAFNSMWHTGLFYKLFRIGITGKGWRLLVDSWLPVFFTRGKCQAVIPWSKELDKAGFFPLGFFLLMIDCLFLELDRLNIGHHICDLYVPCVILADDTSYLKNWNHIAYAIQFCGRLCVQMAVKIQPLEELHNILNVQTQS